MSTKTQLQIDLEETEDELKEAKEKLEIAEDKIKDLRDDIEELEDKISDLESELSDKPSTETVYDQLKMELLTTAFNKYTLEQLEQKLL